MPSTTNVLDEARDLVVKRLAELDEERMRLERALTELGGGGKTRPGAPRVGRVEVNPIHHRPARPGSRPGKRRKRRGGTRADQAVALIEGAPGISASDVAKQMRSSRTTSTGSSAIWRKRAGSKRTAVSTTPGG